MRLRGRTASLPPDYLGASLRAPVSPYEIKAGTIIPAVLLSAVNSDLPEQVLGQVREAVYDTENGQQLLVPQETRLVGPYDHHVVYGQERVPITWKRLILPNGSSLSLKDGMPGTDAVGAAGFHDQVNHHDLRTRGNALLLSVISTGVHLSHAGLWAQLQGPRPGTCSAPPWVSRWAARRRSSSAGASHRPWEVRPGYAVTVPVTQDLLFPGP